MFLHSRSFSRGRFASSRKRYVRAQAFATTEPAVAEPIKLVDALVSIVMGSSRGIGKAITLALGGADGKVLVNYAKSSKEVEEVAQQIEDLGGSALVYGGVMSKEADVDALFKAVLDKWGTIDILVNNASMAKPAYAFSMAEPASAFSMAKLASAFSMAKPASV